MKPLVTGFKAASIILLAGWMMLCAGCAHPIVINPTQTPPRNEAALIAKKVAYVMTDENRNKQVITNGGGGDKVSYFPYRDLEKSIRDALRAAYEDVFVVKSATDEEAIKQNNIAYIFTPDITTFSSSESLMTWPPTKFTVEMSLSVTDAAKNDVTTFKLQGVGFAEFSEFKADFGLAGRRASSEAASKLYEQIKTDKRLQ
jgi:hypothetical protein